MGHGPRFQIWIYKISSKLTKKNIFLLLLWSSFPEIVYNCNCEKLPFSNNVFEPVSFGTDSLFVIGCPLRTSNRRCIVYPRSPELQWPEPLTTKGASNLGRSTTFQSHQPNFRKTGQTNFLLLKFCSGINLSASPVSHVCGWQSLDSREESVNELSPLSEKNAKLFYNAYDRSWKWTQPEKGKEIGRPLKDWQSLQRSRILNYESMQFSENRCFLSCRLNQET